MLVAVVDGDANDVGVSSRNAEAFILSFHFPFEPVSSGEEELHLENGSKDSSPFFTSPFILLVTRASSSVVAAESFGISTLPEALLVVVAPPGVVDRVWTESGVGLTDDSTLAGGIDCCDSDDDMVDEVNCGVWDGGVVFNTDTWGETPFCCDMP